MNINAPGENADSQSHGEDMPMEDGMVPVSILGTSRRPVQYRLTLLFKNQPDFQNFPPLPSQGNFPGPQFAGQPGNFGGGFRGNMRGRGMGPAGPGAMRGGMAFRGRGGMGE
jgi:hypothetical protein